MQALYFRMRTGGKVFLNKDFLPAKDFEDINTDLTSEDIKKARQSKHLTILVGNSLE